MSFEKRVGTRQDLTLVSGMNLSGDRFFEYFVFSKQSWKMRFQNKAFEASKDGKATIFSPYWAQNHIKADDLHPLSQTLETNSISQILCLYNSAVSQEKNTHFTAVNKHSGCGVGVARLRTIGCNCLILCFSAKIQYMFGSRGVSNKLLTFQRGCKA